MPCCIYLRFRNDLRVPSLRMGILVTVAGCCLFISSCGGASSSGNGPAPGVPVATTFGLFVTPASLTIVPNSAVTISLKASGTTGVTTINVGTLPAGISTDTAFPLQLSGNAANVTLRFASTVAPGSLSITFHGQSGSLTGTATLPVTVQSLAASFFFPFPLFSELGVPIGGSGQMQFLTTPNGQATNYDIALSLSGLPADVTATLSPSTILPGQTTTVLVAAASSATVSRNITLTLTGTPQAPVPPASISFLLDVTQPPGSLPNNRTDYLSLEGSPNSAVYDKLHNLIFASNPSWNRVVVISNATHTIIKSIAIPDSRSVDISQDNSRVWVGTGGHQIYEIDTTTFATIRHALPGVNPNTFTPVAWEDFQMFALADGTLMLEIIPGSFSPMALLWDPVSDAATLLNGPVPGGFGLMQRSGDGKRVYCFPADSGGMAFYYDVFNKTFSTPVNIGGQPVTGAVNFDGTRVVASYAMFDGDFNFLGVIPGFGVFSVMGGPAFEGGTVFNPDTGLLYEVSMPHFTPVILTIDPNTLALINSAPAMPMIPAGTLMDPPFFMPIPFAVDGTGMVLGLQDYGIAFDDSTYTVNFVENQPGTPTFLQHMSPQSGPLAGGTTSGGFGNAFSITPDVWYGANRGLAHNDASLTITSPPSSIPGPVNIKMLFPDGIEVFNPLFFSYGPFVQTSVQSGAAPAGGSTGQIAGYGLPTSASTGTVTVGGSPAAITSSSARIGSLEFGGYPFPAGTVNFAVPAGSPGFADVTVNTPIGSSTLRKAIYYAQSVTDFSSGDAFSAILYDGKRQQLYLSAGDHIDVFSLAAGNFLSPLTPASAGTVREFAGMALTPDGSTLLVADLLDGSLALINPDNPAVTSFIPVAPVDTSDPRCTRGPLYVASAMNNQAYVATGGFPGIGCGPGGTLFQIDLVNKTSTTFFNFLCVSNPLNGLFVSSNGNGSKVAFADCIYDVAGNTFNGFGSNLLNLQTLAADGNVSAGTGSYPQEVFCDPTGNIIARVANTDVYYGSLLSGVSTISPRLEPKLNDAGSLLYRAWPQFFDIVDVRHGTLTMRFSLPETVSDVGVPMAIDSGGRHIYMITDRGLTIVDLGAAPLSIGSLSPTTAAPGTQVTVRGSGFDLLTSATLGNQPAVVSFIEENTLIVTVPLLASGPTDLVLSNSNGTTYSLESAVTIP